VVGDDGGVVVGEEEELPDTGITVGTVVVEAEADSEDEEDEEEIMVVVASVVRIVRLEE